MKTAPVKKAAKNPIYPIPKQLPLDIVSVTVDPDDPLRIVLTLERVDKDPEQHTKFYVFHKPTRTYTALGAKNIHHATNKASKLYGGEWTGIMRTKPAATSWTYVPVRKFGELLRSAL